MVTLDDVAKEAGVSPSTASRTLNGRPTRVSPSTQARVRDAAERLGYATNLAAQAMAIGRSRSLGVIVNSIPDDYQNPVTAGVFHRAAELDMLVTMAVSPISDIERTRQVVKRLRGQRCSTVFVVGAESVDSPGFAELIGELEWVEREGGRVVMLGQRGTQFDCVVVDDHKAGADVARSLVGIGYREMAVIAGTDSGTISSDRIEGFLAGLREFDIELEPDRVIWSDFSHDGGYRAAGELLRRRAGIEAVFCCNDSMAIGASVRLREAGVEIGAGMALVGCDDMPALRDIDPPLSSVRLPWNEVAEAAFSLAEYERSEARVVVLEGHTVLRKSAPGINDQLR